MGSTVQPQHGIHICHLLFPVPYLGVSQRAFTHGLYSDTNGHVKSDIKPVCEQSFTCSHAVMPGKGTYVGVVERHAIMLLQPPRQSVAHWSEAPALPRTLGLSHTWNTAVPMIKKAVGCRARVNQRLLVMLGTGTKRYTRLE